MTYHVQKMSLFFPYKYGTAYYMFVNFTILPNKIANKYQGMLLSLKHLNGIW